VTHKADTREKIAKKIAETRLPCSLSRYVVSGGETGTPSAKALAERDRRMREPETRDLTGVLLGDPPPQRSALYRKQHSTTHEETSIWDGVDTDDLT